MPGTGKTTFAKVIANEIYGEHQTGNFIEFNASSDRGIDNLRNVILPLAKQSGISKYPYKIILMDEADMMTSEAQASFRRILEQYSARTRFIFTCNYSYRLIPALVSRFTEFEFGPIAPKLIAKRLAEINKNENIGKTKEDIINIAKKCGGDLRRAINYLQSSESISTLEIEKYTIDEIVALPEDKKVELAFCGDPDRIIDIIWEKMKSEKRMEFLDTIANCEFKMNNCAHKEMFLSIFLKAMRL